MWTTLLGLTLDVLGASLLICGELQGHAALLNYWGSGEQKEDFKHKVAQFWWWKRWPIRLGVWWGSNRHLGQESLVDSFPFKAWGIGLLIIGFLLQGAGAVCSSGFC
jgi:hypothetical protein